MIRLIWINILEWIRLKFLHVVLFLVFVYYVLSYLLGSLSFTEQERLFFDFGLGGIEFVTVIIAAFLSTHALFREIERKTILVLLARPISRWQLLVSYLVSLSFLNLIIVFVLGGLLFLWLEESSKYQIQLLISLFIIFLKSLVIGSIGLLFSVIARPMFGLVLTIACWIATYSIQDIVFFAEKLKNPMLLFFSQGLSHVVPNFYLYNWKNYHFLRSEFQPSEFLWAVSHSLFWIFLPMIIASLFFKRKEIV